MQELLGLSPSSIICNESIGELASPDVLAIKSKWRQRRNIDIGIESVIFVASVGLIISIIRRRDLQPIKIKGWKYICLSIVGMILSIIGNWFIKMTTSFIHEDTEVKSVLDVYIPCTDMVIPLDLDSLTRYSDVICLVNTLRLCFFCPVYIIPYFLRAIRIKTIFKQHKEYVLKKRKNGVVAFHGIESAYCVRESILAFWLIFILVCMMTLFIISITNDYSFYTYLPVYNYNNYNATLVQAIDEQYAPFAL